MGARSLHHPCQLHNLSYALLGIVSVSYTHLTLPTINSV